MKRKLLVLSGLFLGLWVVCLFYPGQTPGIHIALLVELVFLLQYVFNKKPVEINAVPEATVMNQPEEKIESEKEIYTGIPDIPRIYTPANMQEEGVLL
ncbi:MAG: hypothetical protein IPI68_11665 [Chitinophagaceae bacterium]|nr:hypothetical protein [Chitinophagaceae bacterium]